MLTLHGGWQESDRKMVHLAANQTGYSAVKQSRAGTLDRAGNTLRWEMKPNTLADKLIMKGTIVIEADGEGRCRRKDEVSIEAKVFGVGKLIESSTEDEVKKAWSTEAAFINRYVKSL